MDIPYEPPQQRPSVPAPPPSELCSKQEASIKRSCGKASSAFPDKPKSFEVEFSRNPTNQAEIEARLIIQQGIEKLAKSHTEKFERQERKIHKLERELECQRQLHLEKMQCKESHINSQTAQIRDLENTVRDLETKIESQRKEEIEYLRASRSSDRKQTANNIHIEVGKMLERNSDSANFTTDLRDANIANYANVVRENSSMQANQYIHNAQTHTQLGSTAEEIDNLLIRISTKHPVETRIERMKVADAAMQYINVNNPSLKTKILSALKAGSIDALGQLLNHPASSFFIAAIKDWQKNSK
ncbi:hypothetical protein IQ266_03225 [filamentous cyanobacterium LEGE 11480]|uniref:Uncharacterized protein n=1 Tax=Romeriopsis navalis LEGE 11480 TaxID=2777977 RepID=A0A928VI53_9CYAN|nr:hypothetical protein [Romeriopsis navalis]MBE9028770.1 hypothetical protein [Romeriopsis navalis LEGE 11480]